MTLFLIFASAVSAMLYAIHREWLLTAFFLFLIAWNVLVLI